MNRITWIDGTVVNTTEDMLDTLMTEFDLRISDNGKIPTEHEIKIARRLLNNGCYTMYLHGTEKVWIWREYTNSHYIKAITCITDKEQRKQCEKFEKAFGII